MTELPKKIIVNRIPYSVCNSNDPYSYEADPGVQEIRVTQEAAPARKRQYFMWEVAHLLLVSAGMSQKEADRYHAGVGSVLNRLVIDNDTDFVKGRKPVPSMIWINGLPYTIQQGIFKELQDEDLGGRVTYDTLYIQIIPLDTPIAGCTGIVVEVTLGTPKDDHHFTDLCDDCRLKFLKMAVEHLERKVAAEKEGLNNDGEETDV